MAEVALIVHQASRKAQERPIRRDEQSPAHVENGLLWAFLAGRLFRHVARWRIQYGKSNCLEAFPDLHHALFGLVTHAAGAP
jgi:hypothetical protein